MLTTNLEPVHLTATREESLLVSSYDTTLGAKIKGLSVESIPRDLPSDQAALARDMIRFLDDISAEPMEVRSCLDSLDHQGLRPFNYHYYYLNLLSVFSQQKSPEEIRELAVACVKFRLWRQWDDRLRGRTQCQRPPDSARSRWIVLRQRALLRVRCLGHRQRAGVPGQEPARDAVLVLRAANLQPQ